MENDLSLVTTEELLDEIERRHDAFVFAGVCSKTDDLEKRNLRYDGDLLVAIGLTALLQHRTVTDLEEASWDTDE